ncbi:MAG TPA: hypothetical protein VJ725_21460 [Thermoanaerobaculia bacterium]|nr:hypothetical protein [Thermoanaerobaculia bacterium]
MRKKKWWKSKTLWINALTVVAGVAGSGLLNEHLSASEVAIVGGVANIALRTITKGPIGRDDTAEPEPEG